MITEFSNCIYICEFTYEQKNIQGLVQEDNYTIDKTDIGNSVKLSNIIQCQLRYYNTSYINRKFNN